MSPAVRPAVYHQAGRELGQLDVSSLVTSASAGPPTTSRRRRTMGLPGAIIGRTSSSVPRCRILGLELADGNDAASARLWIVDTLTSAERAIAARRLVAVRPVVVALVGIAAPEAFWELCRDELRCDLEPRRQPGL